MRHGAASAAIKSRLFPTNFRQSASPSPVSSTFSRPPLVADASSSGDI